MNTDPNYNNNITKISFKRKILSEIINLFIIVSITLTLFSTIGKNVITNKYGKQYIDNINVIYQDLANSENLKTYVSNNYGFLDLDEEDFMNNYINDHGSSKEEAYEEYLEARIKILEKIRNNETFKLNNNKFNTIYFMTFGFLVFIVLFIFEFLLIVVIGKYKNIGMLITKTSIVNLNDNMYPNKFKLILRLFIMFIIEHLIIRLFFGNFYFIILILLNLMFSVISRNKVFMHDIFSGTKEMKDEFVGFKE